jgi:hypothetical protein
MIIVWNTTTILNVLTVVSIVVGDVDGDYNSFAVEPVDVAQD